MIKVTTQNSVYEIDTENQRARRVRGKNDITRNLGADGEWQDYLWYDFAPFAESDNVLTIMWDERRATITSQVRRVVGVSSYGSEVTDG